MDETTRQSVPAAGVKSEVGESLGLQLYVIVSRATDLKLVKANLADHRAYLASLEDEDVLFGAGPLWTHDEQSFEGDGLLVYRAESVDEAKAIANKDPLHTSGARAFEIWPWMLNDGSLNVRVVLSRQIREVS